MGGFLGLLLVLTVFELVDLIVYNGLIKLIYHKKKHAVSPKSDNIVKALCESQDYSHNFKQTY